MRFSFIDVHPSENLGRQCSVPVGCYLELYYVCEGRGGDISLVLARIKYVAILLSGFLRKFSNHKAREFVLKLY